MSEFEDGAPGAREDRADPKPGVHVDRDPGLYPALVSAPQRLLIVVALAWGLLALPAFLLPFPAPPSALDRPRAVDPPVDAPETRLNLRPASPAERRAILDARKVDLTAAGITVLKSLPGIGPETAREIIRYRRRQGPFRRVDQLEEVPGIGPRTLEKLADRVKVGGSRDNRSKTEGDRKINVNRAPADRLRDLPGVGPVTAQSIVEHRTRSGPFRELEDLRTVPGIGPKTLEELRPGATVEPSR